jgi:hypothetical protein
VWTIKEITMSDHENEGKAIACGEKEWQEIIDKIEDAIILSLANKVLEQAETKTEKPDENHRNVKLVEFRGHTRKKQVRLPTRGAS